MEQKTTIDLEIFNDLLDEIIRLYFSGNSIEDIFKYLEKKIGSELFEEVKKYFREVSVNG